MAWLLREGDVLAALDPDCRGWPEAIQGALVRRTPLLVHTFSRSGPLDLAWCVDGQSDSGQAILEVRRISCLGPHRLARPQLLAGAVVGAEGGAFDRWQLRVGDRLEIRET